MIHIQTIIWPKTQFICSLLNKLNLTLYFHYTFHHNTVELIELSNTPQRGRVSCPPPEEGWGSCIILSLISSCVHLPVKTRRLTFNKIKIVTTHTFISHSSYKRKKSHNIIHDERKDLLAECISERMTLSITINTNFVD